MRSLYERVIRLLPVLSVVLILIAVWYAAVAPMNIRGALDQAERSGETVLPKGSFKRLEIPILRLMVDNSTHISKGYALDRPRLPTPGQVGAELWNTTGAMALKGRAWSKRSLIYHGWVTLQSTLFGFALGTFLGALCAIAIVYSRVVDLSLMPWAIMSQTIPIVALAPMIIVLLAQLGVEGRALPKAIISAYLCYFPVLVGMVKGLRSPELSQLDLLRTYDATGVQSFLKLRLPASLPYLFTSLKVGIAAALVGAVVGELPTGAINGLGARILIGDQFGTPLAIWSSLAVAALLAGFLITALDLVQRLLQRRMGGMP